MPSSNACTPGDRLSRCACGQMHGREHHHLSSDRDASPRGREGDQTFFYFVVFPTNSSPIFHSNRTPAELLLPATPTAAAAAATTTTKTGATVAGDAPPSEETDMCPVCCPACHQYWESVHASSSLSPGPLSEDGPVGDHARARGLEEAPQQTLQTVAFPSAFGVGSLRRPPAQSSVIRPKKAKTRVSGNAEVTAMAARRRPPNMRDPNTKRVMNNTASSEESSSGSSNGDDEYAEGDAPQRSPSPSPIEPASHTGTAAAAVALSPPPPSPKSSGPLTTSGAVTALPEGPPWNLRLEEVRTAGGQLRFHRIILTASFTVVVSSHTNGMHSMQTRHSAVALVLSCPPSGDHYRFLLNHFDVCRAMLHRTLAFGMRTTQRFFFQLFAAQARAVEGGVLRITPQAQQRMMRNITSLLEKDDAAIATYMALKKDLVTALNPRQPLPHLWAFPHVQPQPMDAASSTKAQVPFHLSVRGFVPPASLKQPAPLWDASKLLCTALSELCVYSETFLTSCIAGLLALSGSGGAKDGVTIIAQPADGGAERASAVSYDPMASYWSALEAQATAAEAAMRGACAADCSSECMNVATSAAATTGAAGMPMTGVSLRRRPALAPAGGTAVAAAAVIAPTVTSKASASASPGPVASKLRRPARGAATAATSAQPSGAPSTSGPAGPAAGPAAVSSAIALDGASSPATAPSGTAPREGFSLSAAPKARVVIFSEDAVLAQRLMIVASFFLTRDSAAAAETDGGGSGQRRFFTQRGGQGAKEEWLHAARQCYQTCFAARVDAATDVASAAVPVQWVAAEFTERAQEALVGSPYSPDTALLILSPRLLLCRHLQLHKTLETTTLFIEQQAPGQDAAASVARQTQALKLFRSRLKSQRAVPPDGMIGVLVKEAVALEQGSHGAVKCTSVLADMVAWLACQDRTRALQQALFGYDVLCPHSQGAVPEEENQRNHGEGRGRMGSPPAGSQLGSVISGHETAQGTLLSYVGRPSLLGSLETPTSPLTTGSPHAVHPGSGTANKAFPAFPSNPCVAYPGASTRPMSLRPPTRPDRGSRSATVSPSSTPTTVTAGTPAVPTCSTPTVQDVILPGSYRAAGVRGLRGCREPPHTAAPSPTDPRGHGTPLWSATTTPTAAASPDEALLRLFEARGVLVPPELLAAPAPMGASAGAALSGGRADGNSSLAAGEGNQAAACRTEATGGPGSRQRSSSSLGQFFASVFTG